MKPPVHRRNALLALRIPLAVLAVALTLGPALFAGCGLSTGGIPERDDGGGKACTTSSNCDDENPCTTDSCSSQGICTNTPLADGVAPAADQMPGDCQSIVCTAGEPSSVADDTDTPTESNDCVSGTCTAGKVVTTQLSGTMCTTNGVAGSCFSGDCKVACTTASDCKTTNPCVTPSCDGATGVCAFPSVTDGTQPASVTQVAGDCHTEECVGGTLTNIEDDSDIPTAMGDCQDPTCKTGGVPGYNFHGEDTVCSTYMTSMPGFCDGAGHCSQCTKASECSGTTNDCQQPVCTAFACSTQHTAANTPTTVNPPQVAGDCLTIVCDGNGGTMTIPDDSDPANSGTVCITDTCNNGVAGTPVLHPGMMCGGSVGMPEMCSATGMCGCQTNADCTAPNTCGGGNPGTPLFCGCTKTTCAAQNTTCGTISDGCFGTLNCDDNKTDGTETAVDCGGVASANPTCSLTCGQGLKCNANSDCMSGFCVDNVCCNSACNTTCEACSAAKKGQGSDGQCGAIKGGTDPLNQCTAASMASCGNSGGCNGAGACSEWANGTVCVASSCMSSTLLVKAEDCNGTGTCVVATMPTQDCTPYKCGGSPAACTSSCNNDGDCASTAYYCASHACVPKLVLGTACSAVDQCVSGFCADGVCCNSACTGACQACSAALNGSTNGTCSTASNGTNPRSVCGTSAANTCGLNGTCQSGACADWPSGTACGAASCSGGTESLATTCNGTGTCVTATTMPCTPYICGATACLTQCGAANASGDANCVAGDYCDGVAGGTCHPKQAPGATCAGADQCASGFCADGFCCNTACTGACQACSMALNGTANGACDNAVNGTNPHNSCATTASTTCSTNGSCTNGACTDWPSGTACGAAPSCSNGTETLASACNGTGSCVTPSTVACSPYLCGGNACLTGCGAANATGDANCILGDYCDGVGGGVCRPKQAAGAACLGPDECSGGVCGGGFCCAATCTPGGAGSCGNTGSCAMGTGLCLLEPSATSCTTGTAVCSGNGVTTTPNQCDGLGGCMLNPTMGTCPGNASCNGGTCNPVGCGGNNPSGDMKCSNAYYCDGVMAGACQPVVGSGGMCTRDGQCQSNHCNQAGGTQCQ